MSEPRDVTDVIRAIYDCGLREATTAELRNVIAWLRCEIDSRKEKSHAR
jgi:hypothetical protein